MWKICPAPEGPACFRELLVFIVSDLPCCIVDSNGEGVGDRPVHRE
jgi:hypothetical protein